MALSFAKMQQVGLMKGARNQVASTSQVKLNQVAVQIAIGSVKTIENLSESGGREGIYDDLCRSVTGVTGVCGGFS